MKAILAILSFVTLVSRKYRLSSCPSEKSKSALLLVLCPLSTSGQGEPLKADSYRTVTVTLSPVPLHVLEAQGKDVDYWKSCM